MKNKSSILILLICLSTVLSASPGGKHGGKHCSEDQRQERINSLNLTEKQKTEFTQVMTEKREKMHKARQEIHQQTQVELAKVLNTEQMALHTKELEKNKMRKKHRRTY